MGATRSKETCQDPACFSGALTWKNGPLAASPIVVTVCGAAGQIGYSLLPMIASGGMFGPTQRVILQCLDLNLPEVRENMRGIGMELQDGNFSLLKDAIFTTEDAVAFRDADYAILLGAFPRREGQEKSTAMEKNTLIFRTMGHAIQEYAKPSCKVLVVGNPAHTNALICAHYAPTLPKENFFALTRLDQNRAAGQLSDHAKVPVRDITNIVVWGCHAKFPDVDHALIRGQPLSEVMRGPTPSRDWNKLFHEKMAKRGAEILKARKASSAMSTARAIVDHIHDLHFGTRPGEFVSMGVWSDASRPYGLAEGLIFSMPVVCLGAGRYQVDTSLKLKKESQEKLKCVEAELLTERELAMEIFQKHATGNS